MRHTSILDRLLGEVDKALRTVAPPPSRFSQREILTTNPPAERLTSEEKKHIAGLMRVNHAGEVCAQALYQGQALTATQIPVKKQLEQAALEETEHLAWCEQRLRELDSQPSLFNPLWYMGSLCIGAVAGFAGDKWSLGFVAETEHQVGKHLQNHLAKIPEKDVRSHAILKQMVADEMGHALMAENAGAVVLPGFIKKTMGFVAKLMTKTSYYL